MSEINFLKSKIKLGELLEARVLKKQANNQYVIQLFDYKTLAFSDIDIYSKDILVEVIAKNPKLQLKLVPFFPTKNMGNFVRKIYKENKVKLTLFQQFVYFSMKNPQKKSTLSFLEFSQFIYEIYILFDGKLIYSLKEIILSFENIEAQISIKDFWETKIVQSPLSMLELIPIEHKNKLCFVKETENEQFQFVLKNDLLGKFHCVVSFFDSSDAAVIVYIDNSFSMRKINELEKQIKEIFSEDTINLLNIKVEMVSELQSRDNLDLMIWQKLRNQKK